VKSPRGPSTRPVPDRVDVLVVLVVAFPTLMDIAWNQPGTRQADALSYVTAAGVLAALLGRRRWPLPVTVLCGAVLTLWYALGHEGELLNLPTMVALYSVAAQGNRRRSVAVGAVASLWSGALTELTAGSVGSPALDLLWPLVPLALGEAVRAGQELAVEQAAGERLRVAREVHDVVAHTLAGVNVQMEVAVEAFDARPDVARRALGQARTSSRAALRELRATVALLRDGSPGPPPAGLADVPSLIATARVAGVEVEVHDDRAGSPLPPAVDLAAYRIVQEALTNVARHSGTTHADVTVTRSPTTITLEITNPAPTAAGPTPAGPTAGPGPATGAGGHGLVGMAERVAALGGVLEHGVVAGGGYRVRAMLPRREVVAS
jgi:signal transduction histidine kinase